TRAVLEAAGGERREIALEVAQRADGSPRALCEVGEQLPELEGTGVDADALERVERGERAGRGLERARGLLERRYAERLAAFGLRPALGDFPGGIGAPLGLGEYAVVDGAHARGMALDLGVEVLGRVAVVRVESAAACERFERGGIGRHAVGLDALDHLEA